jgi:phytoene synthase
MPARSADAAAAADLAACYALLRGGSRSFYVASHLLPGPLREAACGLYAFCREADDAIDEGSDPVTALAALRSRLAALYRGEPQPFAADRALARVVAAHGIPQALPAALLEGFAWDSERRTYGDLSGVLAYSARVAGSVGVMMAVLMGAREPQVLARAADLGVAMQLTNIARDVGEDARAGRLYLPLDWLREAGIEPRDLLARPAHSEPLGSVVRRLLAVAGSLYARAEAGIAQLPARCRPGIYAARLLYAAIGHELDRRDLDAVSQRCVVSTARKLGLLARVPAAFALPVRELDEPVLAEVRFLVEAVEAHPHPVSTATPARGSPVAAWGERAGWVLELFAELERRERQDMLALPARQTRSPPPR